jgi:hypothetical protein
VKSRGVEAAAGETAGAAGTSVGKREAEEGAIGRRPESLRRPFEMLLSVFGNLVGYKSWDPRCTDQRSLSEVQTLGRRLPLSSENPETGE